jgi:Leucine-rich repeat (LRR) protein
MTKLTDLQIELVKTFSIPMSEETVLEIKDMLSNYFLQKMDAELDKLTLENNWTDKTFEDWSNEHNRISKKG